MKRFSFILVIFLAWAAVCQGYPCNRPLPERVINENEDFFLLRDHEINNRFYLLPKQMTVVEQTIHGDLKPGCSALKNYNEGHGTLLATQELLAKLQNTTAQLLSENVELQKETMKLEKQRVNLEKEIRNAANLGLSETDVIHRRADLTDCVAQIELNQKLSKQSAENVSLADAKASTMAISVKSLQRDLDKFLDHLARPAVELTVRAALPLINLKDTTFKSKFGLVESDHLLLAPIASLGYVSSADADMDFLAKISESELLTKFAPSWNPAPLAFHEADFGKKTLAKDATLAEFPKKVEYRQSLTLYSFCNAATPEKGASDLLVGLSFNYSVPAFIDEKSEDETVPVLISFRRALSDEAWALFEKLPSMGEAEPIEASDQGDPRLFSGEGKFGVNKYNVRFRFPQNRLKLEVK